MLGSLGGGGGNAGLFVDGRRRECWALWRRREKVMLGSFRVERGGNAGLFGVRREELGSFRRAGGCWVL